MFSALLLAAATTATPLSLDGAIGIALKQNLQYQSAQVAVRSVRAQLQQAYAPKGPSLALTDTYQYVDPIAKLSTPFGTLPFSTVHATNVPLVALQYTLYDGGLTAARIGQAEAGLAGVQAQERQARGAVIAQVAKAYYDLDAAISMQNVADRAVNVASAHLREAKELYRNGQIPRADVLRAQTELANQQVSRIQADSAVSLAQTSLDNVLNVPLTNLYQPTDPLGAPAPKVDLNDLLASAQAQRGDLDAARAAVQAAMRAVGAAKAGALPQIKATLADGNTQPAVVGGYHNQFSFALNAVWSLFDNGYTAGRVAQARAGVEQARLDVEQLRNAVQLQVRQAYLEMTQAQARVAAARQLVTLSDENLRLAQIRYRGGVGTALELQDAELRDRSAQQQLTAAQAALRQGVVQLRFAAGLY